MKCTSTPIRALILVTFLSLLSQHCPLLAADVYPFAGVFFPPELVLLAHDRIALTQEQQNAVHARVNQTQPRSDALRATLELETAALAKLAQQESVDEASFIAQFDKVLDVERELKHLHVGTALAIKNLLTPEQQVTLREITKDGGKQLAEDTRNRLIGKVERVKAGAQKWATTGRDASVIAQTLEEKFKPLMDAGKVVEAEATLDRLLEQVSDEKP